MEDLNPDLPVSKAQCFPWIRKSLKSWDFRFGKDKGHLGQPPSNVQIPPEAPDSLPALLTTFA